MLVTKKRLYTELNRVMEIFGDLTNLVGDHQAVIIKRDREIKADFEEIYNQLHSLALAIKHNTERIEQLEAKKQHKTTKKQTKKTKGK